MSEFEVEELEGEPLPKKRRIPRWALFGCGGGCLLLVVLLVALVLGLMRWAEDMDDPEVQWPRLRQTLAFEERPENVDVVGFSVGFVGMDQFSLSGDWDFSANVMSMPARSAAEMDSLFSEEGGSSPMGLGEPIEPRARVLLVQGREVRAITFSRIKGTGQGPGLRIDLSRDDGFRMVELVRREEGEPISDEEVTAFFSLFDVWAE